MKPFMKAIGTYLSTNWFDKVRAIFIAIILSSSITIFEGYWWEETFTIGYVTLLAAVIIDIVLPPNTRLLKLVLQAAAAIFVAANLVEMDWLIAKPESWQDWIWWIQAHAVQLNPFIWISAALLLLYILFGIWTTTRLRMIGFVGMNILILTIGDSFTPIWLWDEVGMVVFIGLLWLVASHLSRLEREHPNSWRELAEYPLQLIVPIALVLTVLMTAGLNMPSLSPLLQDPYTIWKEAKGEQVQVFLGDKGTESLTPSNSGNASSGYSRNDDELGGGFEFDYSPMMTVTTSHRSYWRGEAKAIYTGAGWQDVEVGETLTSVVKGENLAVIDTPPTAGVTKIDQIITMVRKDTYPVLFGASPITTLNWVDDDEAALLSGLRWEASSSELRLLNWSMKNRKYPQTYSVTSSVPVLDEELLRKAKAGWSDETEATRNAFYLQLPNQLPERVKQLARDVTAEATNDYDKAKLLETYLRLTYNYNNLPDESRLTGTSLDFVDQFLFELKEGYCDYFSTAMAVMARSLDLPTRWVKGFAPGVLPISDYGPPGEVMGEGVNPNGSGTYTVRNSDAHSWVEIYFEGFGWIPFEATAGFTFPYTMAVEEDAALPEVDTEDTDAAAVVESKTSSQSKLWTWSAISLLVIALVVSIIMRRNQLVLAWRKFRHGSYTSNDRIVIETQRLLRICKKRGMERGEHETLREAVSRWSESRKRLRDDFKVVLDGFEQAKYSPAMATSEEADRFVIKVRSIIDQLK
ncbi:DUF4129 domain-containing transglutaminase family protein [Paenibacillus sinopodophylli]|uniref:DUF4129 domain-containing transglutaminase family protein n=1 Tax=Paenibacillus sinopodophylli TaxID=1837342 RepID=UPI00110D02D0|nr:transglutaminase domain-containing protein [Paenibacillus sinopodophylli]